MNFEITATTDQATGTIEVSGFGYTVELKQGIRTNPNTKQNYLVYSVLLDKCKPIALSQTELDRYIMFLEFVQYYLQGLNGE